MSEPNATRALGRPLAIVASIVVLATLVASLWVNGSPSAQRQARLDERRIRDLDGIMDAIHAYSDAKKVLPPNLTVLANPPGISLSVVDPVSGVPYEYVATGARTYRLCAQFATDTAAVAPKDYPSTTARWAHGAGRQCFDRTSGTATGLPSD